MNVTESQSGYSPVRSLGSRIPRAQGTKGGTGPPIAPAFVRTRWTGHTSSWPVPQTNTSMPKLRNASILALSAKRAAAISGA